MATTFEDRDQFRDLCARYCLYVDVGPAEAWAELFTDDGVFDRGGDEVAGTEALTAFAAGVLGGGRGLHHLITNEVLDVDGDEATGSASVTVLAGGAVATSGRYQDALRRVDGQWRLRRRRFTPDARPAG